MRLQRVGLLSAIEPAIRREIDERHAPLYKLSWKYDPGRSTEDCTLAYLLKV
jgi:hypothetical protein